jgi:hypothetical protein
MGSTPSTAHRLEIRRALHLQPSIEKLWKEASAAANELSQQWAVRQVQPIASKFAERCIYNLLSRNCK